MACLPSPFRLPSAASFAFSIFAVALFVSKGIRLYTHALAVPLIAFILYLPTFLFLDFLSLCFCRSLFWTPVVSGKWSRLFFTGTTVFGYFLSFVTLGGAASQLSFFLETGGELDWHDAGSYMSPDGFRVLLTGGFHMLVAAASMTFIAFFFRGILYDRIGNFLAIVGENLVMVGGLVFVIARDNLAPLFTRFRRRYRRIRLDTNNKLDVDEYDRDDDWSDDDGDDMTVFSDRRSDSDEPSEDGESYGLLLSDMSKGKGKGGKMRSYSPGSRAGRGIGGIFGGTFGARVNVFAAKTVEFGRLSGGKIAEFSESSGLNSAVFALWCKLKDLSRESGLNAGVMTLGAKASEFSHKSGLNAGARYAWIKLVAFARYSGLTARLSELGDKLVEFNVPSRELRLRRFMTSVPWFLEVALVLFLILWFSITFGVRPRKPYNHMSVTLPVSILGAFHSGPGYCAEQRRLMDNKWPFPELLDKSLWEQPEGGYKGWAPDSANGTRSGLAEAYRSQPRPSWLPIDMKIPLGFFRWDPMRRKHGFLGSNGVSPPLDQQRCPGLKLPEPFYNPVSDPMKISNLDEDLLEPLREALGDGSVKIKHVFFVLMESLRQDLFPIQYDSGVVNNILDANPTRYERSRVINELSQLTRHIEMITGVKGHFERSNSSMAFANLTSAQHDMVWQDSTREGYGGVNVVGAYTGSTMSTKSFATNHCGAWTMPVDKFEESETFSYQPCLPQILGLLNSYKPKSNFTMAPVASNSTSSWRRGEGGREADEDDYHNHPWYPALFESMTEQYDRQDMFDSKIGFKHTVTKKELMEDWRYDRSDPMYQEVNYFSFAEPVLRPYLREYIGNATANNQRMFMTHFTSTTHHNWHNPRWFGPNVDYMPSEGSDAWHWNFNKYLNTVRFHDAWMGELMQMLEDTGVANETLVVFAGDHGQAFIEDYYKKGTYQNGHISNFRVPITFRHPNLPRMQIQGNVSSVSILPTILDLLVSSGSLNERDAAAASDLLPEYEGQSLIRPYRATRNGRRAWNYSVINSGGGMLAITSADSAYRLVMPLGKVFEYRLTDISTDPQELYPIEEWSLDAFIAAVREELGEEAAQWATEAEAIGKWWALERKRLWRYHSEDGKGMPNPDFPGGPGGPGGPHGPPGRRGPPGHGPHGHGPPGHGPPGRRGPGGPHGPHGPDDFDGPDDPRWFDGPHDPDGPHGPHGPRGPGGPEHRGPPGPGRRDHRGPPGPGRRDHGGRPGP